MLFEDALSFFIVACGIGVLSAVTWGFIDRLKSKEKP